MKTIQSTVAFQDSQGNALASGILVLLLSQPAEITSGGGQVVPLEARITLDASGKIPANTQIWANDQLTPSGTTYTAAVRDSTNNFIANLGQWSIAGASPIDLSQEVATSIGASYPAPLLLSPTGDQTINTNNVLPGTDLAQSLGSSTKRWNASLGTVTVESLENIQFADQYATGSNTGGIQEAINALPSPGGTVIIPPNYTATCTVGIVCGTKAVNIQGYGWTSVISGTGITILKFSAATGCSVRNLKITDPTGNASTIGVLFDNGTTGIADWLVENVYILGTGKVSGSIGLKTNFGLIGRVLNGRIEGWDVGASITGPDSSHRSNMVKFDSTDIAGNNTGVSYPNGVDDAQFVAATIENNNIGISAAPAVGVMKLSLAASTHFENNAGVSPQNIALSGIGGRVVSTGTGFYNGTANTDFNITAGLWNVTSIGDTLNEGITNNGTGTVLKITPQVSGTVTGTGVIIKFDGATWTLEQPVSNNLWTLTGWLGVQSDQGLKIKEIAAPAGTSAFDWLYGDSTAHRLKVNNNNGGAVTPMYLEEPSIMTKYNGVSLVANGIPSLVAKVDLTGQTNNIGATLLYAVPASGAGMYRVHAYLVITTAAGTSSTLPSCQIQFTDSETSVTNLASSMTQTTTVNTVGDGSVNSAATAATVSGTMILNAKASTNINFVTNGYASNAANAMTYSIHLKLEYLGS